MANEQVTIDVSVLDNATDALQDIAASLQAMQDEQAKANDETQDGAEETDKYADTLAAAASPLQSVITGVTAAAAGVAALTAVMFAATEVSARYESATNALQDALATTGLSGEELQKRLATSQTAIDALAQSTGQSIDELRRGLAALVDSTGNAAQAERDLALAADISARSGRELEDAVDLVNDARRGAIGSIADLLKLTEQEEEVLEALPSKQARVAQLMGLLEERFAGASGEIQSTQLATLRVQSAQEQLVATLGKAIDQSGLFSSVLNPLAAQLKSLEGVVVANSAEIQRFALSVGEMAVKALAFFATQLVRVVTAARAGAQGFKILASSAAQVPTLLLMAASKVQDAILGIGDALLDSVNGVIFGLTKAARALGQDGLAKELDGFESAIARLRTGVAQERKAAAKELSDLSKIYDTQVDLQAQQARGLIEVFQQGTRVEERIARTSDTITASLRKRSAEVKKLGGEEATRAARNTKIRKSVRAAADARAAQLAAQRQAERDLERLQTQRLLAASDAERLRLDDEIRATEARVNYLGIEDQGLQAATRRRLAVERQRETFKALAEDERSALDIRISREEMALALVGRTTSALLIRLKSERALIDVEAQGLVGKERELALLDMEAQRREQTLVLQREQNRELERQVEQVNTLATSLQTLTASGTRAGQGIAAGFGGISQVLNQIVADQAKVAEGTISAAQATENALGTAGQATAGFAAALGASAAQQAAILAIFELASAIASFAAGNVASGAQHLVAAGLYGTIAGTEAGGGGGGASASAGGSAGAVSAGGNASTVAATQQQGAEILADAIAERTGEGQNVTIIFDQRDSLVVDDGGLFDRVNRGARQEGFDLRDTGRARR